MMMMMLTAELGIECPSFLHVLEPYTSVQSEDQTIFFMALKSISHQCLCQQGILRREAMTDCGVAGVFGQNGVI